VTEWLTRVVGPQRLLGGRYRLQWSNVLTNGDLLLLSKTPWLTHPICDVLHSVRLAKSQRMVRKEIPSTFHCVRSGTGPFTVQRPLRPVVTDYSDRVWSVNCRDMFVRIPQSSANRMFILHRLQSSGMWFLPFDLRSISRYCALRAEI